MTPRTARIAAISPRRGLNREEAAIYVGVSASKFDELVRAQRMPPPKRIGGRNVWDILALDRHFDALPGGDGERPNSWDDAFPDAPNPWDGHPLIRSKDAPAPAKRRGRSPQVLTPNPDPEINRARAAKDLAKAGYHVTEDDLRAWPEPEITPYGKKGEAFALRSAWFAAARSRLGQPDSDGS